MLNWMRGLSVRRQLLLICFGLALPGLVLTVLLLRSEVISLNNVRNQQQGLHYLQQLRSLANLVAQHRAQINKTIQLTADAEVAKTAATETATGISNGWSRLAALNAADANQFGLSTVLSQSEQRWQQMLTDSGVVTAMHSHQEHQQLLLDLQALQAQVLEASGLLRNPDVAINRLVQARLQRLAWVQMQLVNTRDLAAVYASKSIRVRSDQLRMSSQIAVLNDYLEQLVRSTDTVSASLPALHDSLDKHMATLTEQSDELVQQIYNQLLADDAMPEPEMLAAAAARVTTQLDTIDTLLATPLQSRVDRQAMSVVRGALMICAGLLLLFGVLLLMAYSLCKSISAGVRQLSAGMCAVASGKLHDPEAVACQGEFAQLLDELAKLREILRTSMTEAHEVAEAVRLAAHSTAAGADELNLRSQQQAAGLEQSTAGLKQITAVVQLTAGHAAHANRLAEKACSDADQGGEIMAQTIRAINEINNSSSQIAAIIGVIDEIAFQTNLLALNAAVEAARAGEQGRGFAVVAGEVRHLAQRSAAAAREIRTLIADSVHKVANGVQLVGQSGSKLTHMMSAIREVGQLVSGIAQAAHEQARAIEQSNSALGMMERNTQENMALVERTCSASRELALRASSLLQLIGFFEIDPASACTPVMPAGPMILPQAVSDRAA